MRLQYSIAITLGFITCLSSFMLGLGQNDFLLPLLMFLAAAASLYATDFRHWIRLGDWTVNALVILIVFLTIGDIVSNQAEDLAFSIARTLVFVEMVLLFRQKEPRFCWQILLISLLQVVVATVMQQSLLFGLLLILYVFSGLCAFVLIFLERENLYFRRHSFIRSFFDSMKAEMAVRHDRGRLARIALVTLITGPLSLVLSFSSTEQNRRHSEQSGDEKNANWDLIRSLFAVFSRESTTPSKAWHEALWEDEPAPPPSVETDIQDVFSKKKLVPVPGSSASLSSEKRGDRKPGGRFPLLSERPSFSAGTLLSNGLEGGRTELFRHLVFGTLFSLIIAVFLFCFIPRIGKVEFWSLSFSFGHDNWTKPFRAPVGTVGFREEVRLGSLGSILPYHREVLSLRFLRVPGRSIPDERSSPDQMDFYDEIQGATVYLRGVALDRYDKGVWTVNREKTTFASFSLQEHRHRYRFRFFPFDKFTSALPRTIFTHSIFGVPPGAEVPPGTGEDLFFDKRADLVGLDMKIQPLDTTVFFAPWPFFCRRGDGFRPPLFIGGSVNEIRRRDNILSATVYTTVFKHGVHLPLVPCQEPIDRTLLTQLPERGLESLTELARQWDDASGLPKKDLVGRALYMEQQFLHSNFFSYKLGKTSRDFSLDPLEDFVGKNPSGHCEYFAGALSMMLRSVGIGSRVIVGFKTYIPNGGAQGCLVRQSDAHAWVEIYLPPESLGNRTETEFAQWWAQGGWYRLDPTPVSNTTTMMKTVSFGLTDLTQWVRSLWGEFVLNMNASKQSRWIYEPIREGAKNVFIRIFTLGFWQTAIPDIVQYYRSLLFQGGTAWRKSDWIFLALPFLILAAILVLLRRLLRLLRPHFRRSSDEERRRKASIEFYVRMERLLARCGRERLQNETPREYARQALFADRTAPIVDAFYRVRFGGVVLSDGEIHDIRDTLDRLEKELSDSLSTHEST